MKGVLVKVRAGLVACLLLAVALAGCAAQPKPLTGAFVGYETRGTGQYQVPVDAPDEGAVPLREIREPTGNAYIKLADGTQVTATCPLSGLKKGNTVFVQENVGDPEADNVDSWVVIGKR